MSEERRPVHPQEPAEGSQEDVEAPGASESREDTGSSADGSSEEERSQEHPQEPAEGGDDDVDAPGVDRPSNNESEPRSRGPRSRRGVGDAWPRLLWPDTMTVATDGCLYVTANQIHQPSYNGGQDLRQAPYVLSHRL